MAPRNLNVEEGVCVFVRVIIIIVTTEKVYAFGSMYEFYSAPWKLSSFVWMKLIPESIQEVVVAITIRRR